MYFASLWAGLIGITGDREHSRDCQFSTGLLIPPQSCKIVQRLSEAIHPYRIGYCWLVWGTTPQHFIGRILIVFFVHFHIFDSFSGLPVLQGISMSPGLSWVLSQLCGPRLGGKEPVTKSLIVPELNPRGSAPACLSWAELKSPH